MGKQRLTFFTIGFGVLILLVVFFFVSTTIRRSDYIRLPEQTPDASVGEDSYEEGSSRLPLLTITPETVQQAIATMARPENYSRSVTITTFWGEQSATDVLEVAVSGELTRVDTPLFGGSMRHLLTNNVNTAIWYDETTEYRLFSGEAFSSDQEQRIPTYEDILALSVEEIAVAVYGEYEGHYCISVLTAKDASGYETAYWISVESGLLVAAEIRQEDTLVYRMTALSLNAVPEQLDFLLPDGTELPAEREEPPVDTDEKPAKPPVVSKPEEDEGGEVVSPSDMVL